jgi:hypothetical protein
LREIVSGHRPPSNRTDDEVKYSPSWNRDPQSAARAAAVWLSIGFAIASGDLLAVPDASGDDFVAYRDAARNLRGLTRSWNG